MNTFNRIYVIIYGNISRHIYLPPIWLFMKVFLIFEARGIHPLMAMMHISLCFRFLPIAEKFSDSMEIISTFTFSPTNFGFHLQKFLMTFFIC